MKPRVSLLHRVSKGLSSSRCRTRTGFSAQGTVYQYVLPVPLVNAPIALQVGNQPQSATLADLDGDGHLDLVVAHFGSDTLVVRRGLGTGQFTAEQRLEPNVRRQTLEFATGSRPVSAIVEDFNGDSMPDVAVVNFDSGSVEIFVSRR